LPNVTATQISLTTSINRNASDAQSDRKRGSSQLGWPRRWAVRLVDVQPTSKYTRTSNHSSNMEPCDSVLSMRPRRGGFKRGLEHDEPGAYCLRAFVWQNVSMSPAQDDMGRSSRHCSFSLLLDARLFTSFFFIGSDI
jgi:hypothetical protein